MTAAEAYCDTVQARIDRYYGSTIYRYYGPEAATRSVVWSTNGYDTGGGARVVLGNYTSPWGNI
ncbi:MAG: hypothetical protein ACRC0L_02985 [Angustibacter sp.]